MESLHFLEHTLAQIVTLSKFCLEMASVLCVILGFAQTLRLAWRLNLRTNRFQSFNTLRLCFGTWLALALEFQLGADILATTVAPSLESLGQLALIAVIRTFLNYFLSKELEAELKLEKERTSLSNPEGAGL
ncbi:MAG: DUF1622 domain-containing protein [Cyanobacteria bacterium RI_101]|nr:DUF1622 domain-containing protein [Cyanobacteria bacterium RI_101]